MKKFFIIIFLSLISFLLFTANCFTQPSLTWNKIYSPSISNDAGQTICASNNGSFFVFGNVTLNPYLLKINKYGDTLWSKYFPQVGLFRSAVTTNDSGCIFTGYGSQPFAIRLDTGGNILWTKYYGSGTSDLVCIRKTSDGGYILCGLSGTFDSQIIKLNFSGDLEWRKTYTASFSKYLVSVDEAVNGGYIASGSISDFQGDTTKIYILKIDNSGNFQWEKKYKVLNQAANGSFISKINQQYVIMGSTKDSIISVNRQKEFIMRIDLNGEILFVKKFQYYKGDQFECANVISNNRFILSSFSVDQTSNNDTSFAKVIIVDSLGNIIKQKYFIDTFYVILSSVLPLNNGDILFTGVTRVLHRDDDILIIRTDDLLNAPPIAIKSYSNEVPSNFKLYQNYPNPFNPNTVISFDIVEKSFISLKVYDVIGREVVQLINKELAAGSYNVNFDAHNLASGIYIYTLKANDFSMSKKMVYLA